MNSAPSLKREHNQSLSQVVRCFFANEEMLPIARKLTYLGNHFL